MCGVNGTNARHLVVTSRGKDMNISLENMVSIHPKKPHKMNMMIWAEFAPNLVIGW